MEGEALSGNDDQIFVFGGTETTATPDATPGTPASALPKISRFATSWLRGACYSDARRLTRSCAHDTSRSSWEGGGAGTVTSTGELASFAPPMFEYAKVMDVFEKGLQ